MALVNKITNTLRHKAKKLSNFDSLGALRFITSSRLFVGGLSYTTDEISLREAFSRYGDVIEARIIVNPETGNSRGFGFVSYSTPEAASSAIQAMDGEELHARWLKVDYATERPTDLRPDIDTGAVNSYSVGDDAHSGGFNMNES